MRTTAGAVLLAVALLAPTASGAPAGGTAPARTVTVVLKEWTLRPSVSRVGAGRVTFVVRNAGAIPHELVVLRTTRPRDAIPVKGSTADETGRATEVEELGPGTGRRVTATLRRGKYVLVCNLPGHYRAGQFASLTVE